MTDQTGIDDATAVVNHVLDALGPPPDRDPATEQWREALADAGQHENCAWRGLAEKARAERDKARAQLVEANSTFLRSGGQIYVARTAAGACVLCGGPIRRNDAVEVASTSTTKPEWHHCFCLIPGGES